MRPVSSRPRGGLSRGGGPGIRRRIRPPPTTGVLPRPPSTGRPSRSPRGALPTPSPEFERNPQNCAPPEVVPRPDLTAEEAVRLQCGALADCHAPRRYHGLQVLYEFACDAGQMERSRFFGFSADLYHFDHFMGKAGHHFKALVGAAAWAVEGAEPGPRGRVHVTVRAEGRAAPSRFVFVMQRHDRGKYEGCWCTAQLLPAGSKWLEKDE